MITNPTDGKFELLELPYAEDALAPVISAETIRYHHGKHHLAYVNNLNAALPGSPFENLPPLPVFGHQRAGAQKHALRDGPPDGLQLDNSALPALFQEDVGPENL